MANKEAAQDVIQILKHVISSKDSKEYQAYVNKQVSLEGLIKIISTYYYDEKIKELKDEILSDEQIKYVTSLLYDKNKVAR